MILIALFYFVCVYFVVLFYFILFFVFGMQLRWNNKNENVRGFCVEEWKRRKIIVKTFNCIANIVSAIKLKDTAVIAAGSDNGASFKRMFVIL